MLFRSPSAAGTRTACSGAASTARGTEARRGNQRWAKGLNTETKQADQWAYGSIAQYNQLLATDAKPLTVYAFNTSTGFHPPHSDTVYRSDDGGQTLRATYFQDPRFQSYNVAPDWETASCGQCFKGGETPFGCDEQQMGKLGVAGRC